MARKMLWGVVAGVVLFFWGWYGFPAAFTVGAFVDQAVGFALMGLVLAGKVKG